jgi:hypothetical protein
MDDLHLEYYQALDRLKTGKTKVVAKGTKITNDAVSLEAGRGKGSIKKSRAQFRDLIAAIELAANEQARPKRTQAEIVFKSKKTAKQLQEQLDAALAREHSLLIELYGVRQRLNDLTGERVLPIRRRPRDEA